MKHYIDFIAEQLKTLTAIPSPSGYTKNATDYLMKLLQDMGYEPKLSRKGNVFVYHWRGRRTSAFVSCAC